MENAAIPAVAQKSIRHAKGNRGRSDGASRHAAVNAPRKTTTAPTTGKTKKYGTPRAPDPLSVRYRAPMPLKNV